jgi:hypothetical protein
MKDFVVRLIFPLLRLSSSRGELGIAKCKMQIANLEDAGAAGGDNIELSRDGGLSPILQFAICNLQSPVPPVRCIEIRRSRSGASKANLARSLHV